MKQLCQLAGVWKGDVAPHGTLVEPKIDGVRALWIMGRLATREGADLAGVGHIAEACRAIEAVAGRSIVLDGELQAGGSFGATLSHIARQGRGGDAGTLHLFDCLWLDDWRRGGTTTRLIDRKAMLVDLVERALPPSGELDPGVAVMPDHWAADARDVESMAAATWAAGGEGLMIKDAESGYVRARSNDWRKVKRALVLELPVRAVICRDDAPGRAVALACELDGVQVRVPLATGIAERDAIWRNQFGIIGALARVGAMERTAKGSLREPRYLGMVA